MLRTIENQFRNIVILLFAFLMFSCSERTGNIVRSLIKYDSLSVNIDYPILSNYLKLSSYVSEGNVYSVGYNHHTHSLDFINLSNTGNKVVELQREGPDAVFPPVAFCLVDNYVVWEDASGIALLTMDGELVRRLPVDDSYLLKPKGVTNASLINLHEADGCVFIPIAPIDSKKNVSLGKVYDLKKQSLDFLPVEYPYEVLEVAELLGGLAFPAITGGGERMLYNFPYSSMVYCYNKRTGETEKIDMMSQTLVRKVDAEDFRTKSPREKFEAESMSARFSEVYYSPELKIFYRIHYGVKERLFDKEREAYLMLYDESTEKITEYLLPTQFSEQYIVDKDIIYFIYKDNGDFGFRYAKVKLKDL